MITVFTPSYNREKELKDLYKSLVKQDSKNFEWLIVDDGSKDNTKEVVKKFKSEKKIKINYVYKENGGKQSAYNKGLEKAKGEMFLCIDSDDTMNPKAISTIEKDFLEIKGKEHICGVMYVQADKNKKKEIIGTKFSEDFIVDNYFDIYHKHKVVGDKLIVFWTSIAKEYPFPLIPGEKFVPEALIYNRITKDYEFLCRNKVAAYKEYLNDGYSANYFNLVKRNPKGNALYFKEAYDLEKNLYNIYGYILFNIYAKNSFKNIIGDHPAKLLCILMYIPTWIVSKIKR